MDNLVVLNFINQSEIQISLLCLYVIAPYNTPSSAYLQLTITQLDQTFSTIKPAELVLTLLIQAMLSLLKTEFFCLVQCFSLFFPKCCVNIKVSLFPTQKTSSVLVHLQFLNLFNLKLFASYFISQKEDTFQPSPCRCTLLKAVQLQEMLVLMPYQQNCYEGRAYTAVIS